MPKSGNPGALAGEQLISLASPFGGWASDPSGSPNTTHYTASIEGVEAATFAKQNTNQYAESAGVSLFPEEKFGHIANGYGWSVVADPDLYIDDLPLNGIFATNTERPIVVTKLGSIVELTNAIGGGTNARQANPSGYTPVSSNNPDLILFKDYATVPVEYAIWSYDYSNAGSKADIAIIQTSGVGVSTGFNGSWYYTTLGASTFSLMAGVPHKLAVGPDGNIYVTNGPFLQQITVTGALSTAALGTEINIGAGWVISGITVYKTYVAVIASNQNQGFSYGKTKVFLWNGLSTLDVYGSVTTAPQFAYDVPDNFGNGIACDGTTLWAFTNGRNNTSKIFELTSKGFVKVFETPFVAPSIFPIQGNIEYFQDGLMLAAKKGDGLGHLFRFYAGGFHDEGYVCNGDVATGTIATAVGLCKNFFTNLLYVGISYNSGASYALYYQNRTAYQTSSNTTGNTIDLRSILYTSGILGRREYPMGFKMSFDRGKIFFSNWVSGSALYLSLFRGYDSCLPGNVLTTNGGVDLLNVLLDTDSTKPNGLVAGTTNPGGYTTTDYYHYCVDPGSDEFDLSDISIVDVSSFYMNIRWKHTSTSVLTAIRRFELHVAQSQ